MGPFLGLLPRHPYEEGPPVVRDGWHRLPLNGTRTRPPARGRPGRGTRGEGCNGSRSVPRTRSLVDDSPTYTTSDVRFYLGGCQDREGSVTQVTDPTSLYPNIVRARIRPLPLPLGPRGGPLGVVGPDRYLGVSKEPPGTQDSTGKGKISVLSTLVSGTDSDLGSRDRVGLVEDVFSDP